MEEATIPLWGLPDLLLPPVAAPPTPSLAVPPLWGGASEYFNSRFSDYIAMSLLEMNHHLWLRGDEGNYLGPQAWCRSRTGPFSECLSLSSPPPTPTRSPCSLPFPSQYFYVLWIIVTIFTFIASKVVA